MSGIDSRRRGLRESGMALGFFQHLAAGGAVAWSGGSEPGTAVNAVAVEAMRERGIDISSEFPKPWTDETVRPPTWTARHPPAGPARRLRSRPASAAGQL